MGMIIVKDQINKHDVILCDIFYLNYYGINILFEVVKTYEEEVYVCELKLKKISHNYETLTNKFSYSKNPYIVEKEKNVPTKSNYRVVPIIKNNKVYLPFTIECGSRLHNFALKNGEFPPIIETVYAEKIEEAYKYKWEIKYDKKKSDKLS